jgi:uncharacterized protein DUF2442
MNTSAGNPPPEVQAVKITDDALTFDLIDGRSISVPLAYYPTLMLATKSERKTFEICGSSVYWPKLDCDLSSEHLLRGAKEAPYYAQKAYERADKRKRTRRAA